MRLSVTLALTLLTLAVLGPAILAAQGVVTIPPRDGLVQPNEATVSPSARAPSPSVALQPFGALDPVILDTVAAHVRSLMAAEVAILPPRSLPDSAYYAPRHRYRGDALLAFLDRATPAGYSHVVGITDRDISVTNGRLHDWGVFGVARLAGRPGVVSTFRLGAGSPPVPVLRARLENVVVHELGHTFGLPHCTSAGCVMRDAEGSIRPVDASTGKLCPSCASRLDEIVGRRS